MDNSKNNKNKYDFKFNDFEAEQLTTINKSDKKGNDITINTIQNSNNKVSITTPKYLQERTIFLMDNDNKVLFNAFVKEKQWTKSYALNYIIREFLKK